MAEYLTNKSLRKPGEQMPDRELQAILHNQITNSNSYLGGEVSEDRREAMDLYYGEPLGNEVEGRSRVVSTDVQDTIEAMLPDLMQIFGASDELARFEPVDPGDEEVSDQATDYVNHIFNVDNEGFLILHDWFKDALLQINGVVKCWWDRREEIEKEHYTGLTSDEMAEVVNTPGVELIEDEARFNDKIMDFLDVEGVKEVDIETPDEAAEMLRERGVPEEAIEGLGSFATIHDFTIKRTKKVRRCVVEVVPPEEFLISRRAKSLDDAPFLCHRVQVTISDLLEMGYDEDQLEGLPDHDTLEFTEERIARHPREDEWDQMGGRETDSTMRRIVAHECYLKLDYDNDGVAELRRIMVAGPHFEVLNFSDDDSVPEKQRGEPDNFQVPDHPFETVTPIRMSHKFFGRAITELVEDIQKIKTSIWRSLLDNAYNLSNVRQAISNKVELEDVLSNRVAAPYRVDTDLPDVDGHIVPVRSEPIGPHLYPMMEYLDTVRETRTGVNRLAQGLDPNALDSTAGGINMLLGRSQQRILMIAQMFAHMGVKRLARKILRTIIRHQDKPRMIRLRNEFVEMDPRTWNAEMDVTVSVGLGHGTQQQQTVAMQMFMQITEKLIALQEGLGGPFVTADKLRNQIEKFGETIGLKNVDSFINEVTEDQGKEFSKQQSQKPNPEMAKVQAEGQMKQAQLQADGQMKQAQMQAEGQMKAAQLQSEQAMKGMQIEADAQAKAQDMSFQRELETAKLMLDREKSEAEMALKREELYQEVLIKREMAGLDAELKREDLALDAAKSEADINLKREHHHADLAHATETHRHDTEAKAKETKGNGKEKAAVVNVHVGGKKHIDITRDKDGNIDGAEVTDGD